MTTFSVGDADAELSARLDRELTAFNHEATGAHDDQALSVRLVDEAGELIGGLPGWAWGGTGGISMLWISADHRRQGLGSTLVEQAEPRATRQVRRTFTS